MRIHGVVAGPREVVGKKHGRAMQTLFLRVHHITRINAESLVRLAEIGVAIVDARVALCARGEEPNGDGVFFRVGRHFKHYVVEVEVDGRACILEAKRPILQFCFALFGLRFIGPMERRPRLTATSCLAISTTYRKCFAWLAIGIGLWSG